MANFVKCKQESVKFKQTKELAEEVDRTILFFFKRKGVIYKEIPDDDGTHENTPINLDLVKTLYKIKRVLDRNSRWGSIEGSKEKPGIYFTTIDGSSYNWYYEDEKTRNEQYEEIASNHHAYKTKVNF